MAFLPWSEKYRPKTIDEYIGNTEVIDKIKKFIKDNNVKNILLYGTAGTGKTSLAHIITKAIDADVLFINGSDENGIDVIRDRVKTFASTSSFKEMKVVIFDEACRLTPQAQDALKSLMEAYIKQTRFIFTVNHIERIIEPLQSRCELFHIKPLSEKKVGEMLIRILKEEKVEFDAGDVVKIVKLNFPDIRQCINHMENQCRDDKLILDKKLKTNNYLNIISDTLFDKTLKGIGKIDKLREQIVDANIKDFTTLFQHLYRQSDKFPEANRIEAIIVIGDWQYKSSFVVDKEIPFVSMLCELEKLI